MRLIEDERITVLPGPPTHLPVAARPPGPRRRRPRPRCGWPSPARPWCRSSLIERMRRGAGHRPGGHRVRPDRGGGRHDVPRRRRPPSGRDAPAAGRSPAWRSRIGDARASSCCAGDYVMLGYLDDPEATARGDRRRRLAAHRRRRAPRRARQPDHHRPAQGHVHLRRLQRLSRRGRAGAVRLDGVAESRWSACPTSGWARSARRSSSRDRRPREDACSPSPGSGWPTSRCRAQVEFLDVAPPQPRRQGAQDRAAGPPVNLDLSPAELAFRDEARAWLTAHVPAEPLPSMDTAEGFAAHQEWEARAGRRRGGRWSAGPRSTAAAAPRSSSGCSSRRSTTAPARRDGSARTASSCSPPRSSRTAPPSSRTAGCPRWRPARRSGRRRGPSPRPGPTSPRCAPGGARRVAWRLGALRPEDLVLARGVRPLGLRALPQRPGLARGTTG